MIVERALQRLAEGLCLGGNRAGEEERQNDGEAHGKGKSFEQGKAGLHNAGSLKTPDQRRRLSHCIRVTQLTD
ncbi:hypothetical protein D3C78_1691480 [compost metagenome]